MVAFQVLAGLLALASPLMVLADVTPSEPGPGSVFKAGQTCRLTWLADTDSTTLWKNMAIELMSGSNLDMVHVTSKTLPAYLTFDSHCTSLTCVSRCDEPGRYERRKF
jgi:hypothetical protein